MDFSRISLRTDFVKSAASLGDCVACRSSLSFFGPRKGYSYARCKECGTLQLSPYPTREELDRAYTEDYASSGHYGTNPEAIFLAAAPFYRALLGELQRTRRPDGPVLDFGCGWGGMLRYLRDAGIPYLGIDFESESLSYCRKLGLDVRAGTLDSIPALDRKFGAVLLSAVFEHLINHREIMKNLGRVLLPGGLVIILIPTASLFTLLGALALRLGAKELPALHSAFVPPWHTTIFSLSGARQVIAESGFCVERVIVSPSGTADGAFRVVQLIATVVAQTGFSLFGERWPLAPNHILICRKENGL